MTGLRLDLRRDGRGIGTEAEGLQRALNEHSLSDRLGCRGTDRTLAGLKETFRNEMILNPKPLQRESFFWYLLSWKVSKSPD